MVPKLAALQNKHSHTYPDLDISVLYKCTPTPNTKWVILCSHVVHIGMVSFHRRATLQYDQHVRMCLEYGLSSSLSLSRSLFLFLSLYVSVCVFVSVSVSASASVSVSVSASASVPVSVSVSVHVPVSVPVHVRMSVPVSASVPVTISVSAKDIEMHLQAPLHVVFLLEYCEKEILAETHSKSRSWLRAMRCVIVLATA